MALLRTIPRPRDERLDTAFETFRRERDRYELLYFGSSRVYRGIRPRLVDAELGHRGLNVTSFNLGMRGMGAHETNELLRRVLALRPARLRYVVVELDEWQPEQRVVFTQRAVGWHDFTETLSVLRTARLREVSAAQRLTEIQRSLKLFGARSLNLGVASDAVRRAFGPLTAAAPDGRDEQVHEVSLRRGFAPFTRDEYSGGLAGEHRVAFLAGREAYEAQVAALPRSNAGPADLAAYNLVALRDQIERVREVGAEIVYLIMPAFDPQPMLHRLADAGHVPKLIAFDDPTAYPELFRVEHRFDYRHLDEQGAALFAPILAERLAEAIVQR
jgi:hypothetical protein